MSDAPPLALCDTCGNPHLEDEAIYTIASQFDDDGNLISFRHWACKVDVPKAVAKLREAITRAEDALKGLR